MPFIQISSVKKTDDIKNPLNKISAEFSKRSSIEEKHITLTWNQISSNHLCHAGKLYTDQVNGSPLIIDLLVPDFTEGEKAEKLLNDLADSISATCDGYLLARH